MHTVKNNSEDVKLDREADRIFGPLEASLRDLLELAEEISEVSPPTYAEFHYGKEVEPCDECDGNEKIDDPNIRHLHGYETWIDCPKCKGSGVSNVEA